MEAGAEALIAAVREIADRVSPRRIAEESGVSHATIYRLIDPDSGLDPTRDTLDKLRRYVARVQRDESQVVSRGTQAADRVRETAPEPYSPNAALSRDYPARAYEVVLGYLRRLERAGLSHEEIEKFERTLLNRRFAQRFRTEHGVEWGDNDYILHVESLWQAMMDALATRGVVP